MALMKVEIEVDVDSMPLELYNEVAENVFSNLVEWYWKQKIEVSLEHTDDSRFRKEISVCKLIEDKFNNYNINDPESLLSDIDDAQKLHEELGVIIHEARLRLEKIQ